MKNEDKILKYMKTHNGTITSKIASKLKIHRQYLVKLERENLIERVERGVYILPEFLEDQMFVIQQRFKKGVYSHGTALYLHGLTDRIPQIYTMTFPNSYNTKTLLSEGINVYQSYKKYHSSYKTKKQTTNGNMVFVYTIEKTLCDIVRGNSRLNIEEITNAFKMYAKRDDKNLHLLTNIAKTLKVTETVKKYMEVLV